MLLIDIMIQDRLDIPEQNILIVGNRSYKNLGDELILLGTIKLLLKERKHILIVAYDPTRLQHFLSQFIDTSSITFLKEIPKGPRSLWKYITTGKRKEWKKRKKVDAIIIGGGEILTEENRNAYRYRIISIFPLLGGRACWFKKIPMYLMGGIQIPRKNINKSLFKLLLHKTKKIFARDFVSVNELKNFGFDNSEFFMDTAYFAYDRKKIENEKLNHGVLRGRMENEGKKYIIVNINKNGEHFFEEILQDVKHYIEQGYEVYFVPVSIGTNKEYSDIYFYHKLKTILHPQSSILHLLKRDTDFKHFVEKIANAEIVISTRLHLFLIASFLKVKTKVYPYQKKILKMQEVINKI